MTKSDKKVKFVRCSEKGKFDHKLESNDIEQENVVFIEDDRSIWTHGNLYKSVNWGYIGDGEQEPSAIVNLLTKDY